MKKHLLASLGLCAFLCGLHAVLIWTGRLHAEPSSAELYRVGGGWGPSVAHGEAWRLLTSIFLHANFEHLFGNCVGLIAGGVLVDWLVGRSSLLAIYLLGGLFGASLSAIFHPSSVTIGASGAIFAIYGAVVSGLIYSARLRERKGARLFFVLALTHALLALKAGFQSGGYVDNFAHLGGFFAGFAMTCIWYLNKNDLKHRQFTFLIFAAAFLCAGLFVVPKLIGVERMNPIEAEIEHRENRRRMKDLETLTDEYSQVIRSKTDADAVSYTRDSFLPRYQRALRDYEASMDREAPSPREAKVKVIVYGVYSRCAKIYTFVATGGREPASFEGRRPRLQDFIADCKSAQAEADFAMAHLNSF